MSSVGACPNLDHHLAERVALADVGERFGHLREWEHAVDVDANISCNASLREEREMRRTRLDGENPQTPTVMAPISVPIVTTRSRARVVPPTIR